MSPKILAFPINFFNSIMKTTYLPRLIAISTLILLVGYIYIPNLSSSYDDAYITYRYAYNFATGNGFVYNLGENYLGTTAPLYGLILGVLGWFNPNNIPIISGIVSVGSILVTCIGLIAFGSATRTLFAAWIAAMIYVSNTLTTLSLGGEILLVIALATWASWAWLHNHIFLMVTLLSLAILCRGDAIIFALLLSCSYVIRYRPPFRTLLYMTFVATIIILPCLIISYIIYGQILPATINAKIAQGHSGFWYPFWVEGRIFLNYILNINSQNVILGLSCLILVIWSLYKEYLWIPFILWGIIQLLTYLLLNVPFHHWYVVPWVHFFLGARFFDLHNDKETKLIKS